MLVQEGPYSGSPVLGLHLGDPAELPVVAAVVGSGDFPECLVLDPLLIASSSGSMVFPVASVRRLKSSAPHVNILRMAPVSMAPV